MSSALKILLEQDLYYFRDRVDVYANILDMNLKSFKNFEPEIIEGPITKILLDPILTEELLENYYPKVIFNSIYISAFSFLEYRFKHIATRIEFIKKTEIKHTDLKGGNFEIVIEFLEISLGFDKSILKPLEKDLEFYKFIRNKLIHQGGIINLGGKAVNLDNNPHISRIRKSSGIELNDIGQLEIIKKEFVIEFMMFSLKFYEKINKNAT